MATTPKKKPAARKRKAAEKPLRLRGSQLADFEPLSPAEKKLRLCAARGEDCLVDGYTGERPTKPTTNNKIRAAFLRYMILGGCEKSPVHARGIRLFGGFILCRKDGPNGRCLDLEAAVIGHDVGLAFSVIDGSVILRGASTHNLYLNGSALNELRAEGLKCKGHVFLRDGFKASGQVWFVGAKLSGNLECNNSTFEEPKMSLVCDNIETMGNILLVYGFKATGEVRLLGAKLSGSLECKGGIFKGKEIALNCDGLEAKGSIFLQDGFKASGKVRLLSVKLGRDLVCQGGLFDAGLDAQNAQVDGNVWLDEGFISDKTVALRNVSIGGNLECSGGTFADPDISLIANRAKIDGNVNFGGMNAKGTIALTGCEIGGDFTPQGALLDGSPALQLRNTKILGTFYWRSLKFVNGVVDLGGASCMTINMDGPSWMRKRSDYPDKRLKDEEGEHTTEVENKPDKQVNADNVDNGEAEVREEKPTEYTTRLANFTYKGFSELPDGCNATFWIEWLNQQPEPHLGKRFRPRPWEQLAGVLDAMGYEEEARSIRVEKQRLQTSFMAYHEPEARGRNKGLHELQVFWRRLTGAVVDYGFRPGKALIWLFWLMIFGVLVFRLAADNGIMAPTHPLVYKEARTGGLISPVCAENWVVFKSPDCAAQMPSEYSEFSSIMYSIDVGLPVVNLRQQSDWSPRVVNHRGETTRFGHVVRIWEWIETGFGWALSLLFVSAIGGIIRR